MTDYTAIQAAVDAFAAARTEPLEAEIRMLTDAVTKADASLADALAKISELQSLLDHWDPLYTFDLSVNDGWTLRNETQDNDNSRNLPANVRFTPDGMYIDSKTQSGFNRPYTTGDALAMHKPLPNYFKLAVRGRGPHARGEWPCVGWIMPRNSANGRVGEIDLMENFGGQPRVKATLHDAYSLGHMIGRTLPWTSLPGTPDGMHDYVLEKTPNRIFITADGVTLMDVGPADAPTGFDWALVFETAAQEWYFRATAQRGCGTSNPSCATGPVPAGAPDTNMLIESVEVWSYMQDAS